MKKKTGDQPTPKVEKKSVAKRVYKRKVKEPDLVVPEQTEHKFEEHSIGGLKLFDRVQVVDGDYRGQVAYIRAFVNDALVSLDFVGEGVPSGCQWKNYPINILRKI